QLDPDPRRGHLGLLAQPGPDRRLERRIVPAGLDLVPDVRAVESRLGHGEDLPDDPVQGALVGGGRLRREELVEVSRVAAHLRILVTLPAPTVRPPSRMANRRPSSMAIGAPSSTFMVVLSPGMTISVPSARSMPPVTSVVRK